MSLVCLLPSLLVGATVTPVSQTQSSGQGCKKPDIRKEWRTLSNKEKANFITAVHCLETLPHSQALFADGSQPDVPPLRNDTNAYDDLVFAHMVGSLLQILSLNIHNIQDGVNRNHFTGGMAKFSTILGRNSTDCIAVVFLGWHRWFLHTFENTLQTKCGYKGSLPYWDWSRGMPGTLLIFISVSD